jgi:molybdate transport system substrate-binding protein
VNRANLALAGALLPVVGLAIACGTGPDETGGRATVLVFAAASLTDAMAGIEEAFEAEHPDLDIELNLAGSAALRAQILAGAPADVIATANQAVMDDLVAAGAVGGSPTIFATNRLTIAVAEGNPADVTGLEDFARPEPFLGLCAAGVPCGDLADAALERAGVVPDVDTREPDVRALLAKIETGELDAGLVYASDAATSDRVEEIALPVDLAAESTYPVAVLAGAPCPLGARAFVEFLVSDRGREIVTRAGFGPP